MSIERRGRGKKRSRNVIIPSMMLLAAACGKYEAPRIPDYQNQFAPTTLTTEYKPPPAASTIPSIHRDTPSITEIDCRDAGTQSFDEVPGSEVIVYTRPGRSAVAALSPSGSLPNFILFSTEADYSGKTNELHEIRQASLIVSEGAPKIRITAGGDPDATLKVTCVDDSNRETIEEDFIKSELENGNTVEVMTVASNGKKSQGINKNIVVEAK